MVGGDGLKRKLKYKWKRRWKVKFLNLFQRGPVIYHEYFRIFLVIRQYHTIPSTPEGQTLLSQTQKDINDILRQSPGYIIQEQSQLEIEGIMESVFPKLMIYLFEIYVFTFERMPSLLGDNLKSIDITSFPLVVGWTFKITRPMLNSLGDKLAILNKLEALTEDSVNWQPYRKMPDDLLPRHIRAQRVLGKSRTILICFEKVVAVYHRPDLCPRQFNLVGDIRQFNLVGDIVLKKRTGPKSRKGGGTDWSKKNEHVTFISEWDKRFQLLIDNDETGSSPPSDSAVVRASNVDNKMPFACPKRKRGAPLLEKMSPKGPSRIQTRQRTQEYLKRMDQSFQPLTNDDDKKIDCALSDSHRNKTLVTHPGSGMVITGSILQCLKEGKFLNDEKEREKRDPQNFLKCHFFSTFFYPKLVKDGYSYENVRRWSARRNLEYTIFDCDMEDISYFRRRTASEILKLKAE